MPKRKPIMSGDRVYIVGRSRVMSCHVTSVTRGEDGAKAYQLQRDDPSGGELPGRYTAAEVFRKAEQAQRVRNEYAYRRACELNHRCGSFPAAIKATGHYYRSGQGYLFRERDHADELLARGETVAEYSGGYLVEVYRGWRPVHLVTVDTGLAEFLYRRYVLAAP